MTGNLNKIMNLYQTFRENPMQMLSMRFNIPNNYRDPNEIVQYLLNTGQVTQEEVNKVMGMRDNPLIKRLMNTR